MPHCDVVIVGAGVIGSSIAYHLGKRGMRSTMVERESIGARASGKAWAVIVYPPKVFAKKMTHRTVDSGTGVDLAEIPANIKRNLTIIPVDHMDQVLVTALALENSEDFLREGDHELDGIIEAPPGHQQPVNELPTPAGVN